MNADSMNNSNQGIDETAAQQTKQVEMDSSGVNQENRSGQQGGSSGRMTAENLPQDVKDSLPEEAQHIFVAAYNSFLDNGHDAEAAKRVAWQTIKRNEHYTRGEDGKWRRMPDMSAQTRGGVASMPNS